MKFRNLPNLLFSTSTLLFYLINLCNSAAPADLPPNCPTVSANERALLDSCCYSTLLPATQGETSTWTVVDENRDQITWTAVAGGAGCIQSVMVCNTTDDWVITQYINTTLGSGRTADEVQVDILFTCTGDCSSGLNLFYYPVNTEQSLLDLTRLSDLSFEPLGPVNNGSNTITSITTAGFHLAIRAATTVCVTVHRISIIPTVCGEDTVSMITFPEAYPSTASVDGSCLANSEPSGGTSPAGICGTDGMWTTSSSCVCSPGYFLDNDVCTACAVGRYKSTAGNEMCSPCPQNSEALSRGSTICTCQTNYSRSGPGADDCAECVDNFFLSGGLCVKCPENSMSLGGTTRNCTCSVNYTTIGGATSTTGEVCLCRADYHIDSSNQCIQCPAFSTRNITSDSSSTCTCASNHQTESGDTTTSGTVACSGCVSDYFLMDESCVVCPYNSENTQPSSSFCTCRGQSVTEGLINTTTMDSCSSCPANRTAMEMSPLVCVACPDRSERQANEDIGPCKCVTGYTLKLMKCLAEVMLPPEPIILSEGGASDPARITLMLSANSYNFSIIYSVSVVSMFRDRISPSMSLNFPVGSRSASIEVRGDDEALSPSFNITVNVQANDNYIGEGAINATIEDDDSVGVGFLDSQPTTFNESDAVVSIMLARNVTTAQDIQINVVVPPDSSVSVENPITLRAGPPGNTPVMLQILNDVTGGEKDESIVLSLQLESPMAFRHLIDLNPRENGLTNQLNIIIKDDDPPRTSSFVFGITAIIGIAAAGAGLAILIVLILLVCICICRINANRQGFYITEEDKTANPPSMLRYSASLRSISSQTVVPIIDGKGQLAEKENEFYV